MGKWTLHEKIHELLTGHSRPSALMRPAYGPVPSGPNRRIFEVVATRISAMPY